MHLLLALLACTPSDPDEPPVATPYDVTAVGPYAVGWRAETWSYTTPDGRERALTGQLWFPTDERTGAAPRYTDSFPNPLDGIYADAPPARPPDGGWPVLVHSHGHQATGGSGQPLAVWLAAHGWVVIAPDHTPDLFHTILGGENTPPEHWIDRPADTSSALDHLADLPADHPLRGAAHTERALISGHSRGVTTVWSALGAAVDPAAADELCPGCDEPARAALLAGADDPRFVAGIPMAGMLRRSMVGASGEAAVTEPVLSMTGTADTPDAATELSTIAGPPLTWLELAGGCHESFASGLPCPGLDTAAGFRAVGVYALAFGRRHLLEDDSEIVAGVLDGSLSVDAAATLTTFP